MLASWEIYLLFFAYFIHWNISACVCPSTFWHFRQQFRRINVGFSYTDLKIFSAFRKNKKNNNLWSLAWTPSPPTCCGYVGGKLQAAHCYYSQVHGSPLMKGLRDLWDPEGPAHLFHCTKSSTGIRWSLFRREDKRIFVSCCPYMYCMPCLAVGWPVLKALKSILRKFKILLDGEGYIFLGKDIFWVGLAGDRRTSWPNSGLRLFLHNCALSTLRPQTAFLFSDKCW